jgi:hypothetical protein
MSKIEVNQISSQCGSTLTIGQSGDTVTLACGATQTGFGRTGTVDWCTTAKTAPFTGVSGKGYFVNTTCGAVTVTLPATPTAGDIISIKDYARTAATNNINFCRNGSKMDGTCVNSGISTSGESTTLIYVDGTKGWTSILDSTTNNYGTLYITATGGTITTSGDYKIHTFTADGCFSVSCAGNPAGSDSVDYLVVAGGASGGHGCSGGGGGGAGGYRTSFPSPGCNAGAFPIAAQTYPITVGAGAAGVSHPNIGNNGSNSVFSTITSTGGGGGGKWNTGGQAAGGSGGGSAQPSGTGGTGNSPPTSPPQGNNGGGLGNYTMGGGGGAGASGTDGNPPATGGPVRSGGCGGAGSPNSISGSAVLYAGGGGGGSVAASGTVAPGGPGGGGNGALDAAPQPQATAGTANTGGGGGGGGATVPVTSGAGGSGIVIIRYKFQN